MAAKRTIRVYKKGGDFTIKIPAEARCTFGYFNPASAGSNGINYAQHGHGVKTMKSTALRIYADTTDKRQIACFLGVDGFCDESLDFSQDIVEYMSGHNFNEEPVPSKPW